MIRLSVATTACALLAGCVAAPTGPIQRGTEVTQAPRTKFDATTAYKGPEIEWRGSDWSLGFADRMRAQLVTIDGQPPNVGVVFTIEYRAHKWRFYRSANLDDARRLPATRVSSDVWQCRGHCGHTERVSVLLPSEYFAAKKDTGFELRMNADAGPGVVVTIPADHVAKMLAAVPALLQTAQPPR